MGSSWRWLCVCVYFIGSETTRGIKKNDAGEHQLFPLFVWFKSLCAAFLLLSARVCFTLAAALTSAGAAAASSIYMP